VRMRLLELVGVRKSHWRGPHEVLVLESVDLEVGAGELVAVWGSRGSGKTTLLEVAAGLRAPDDGIVSYKGVDLARVSRGERARLLLEEVGWAQRAGPKDETLEMLDYVAVPQLGRRGPRGARRAAAEALTRVGLRGCTGKDWSQLTDGERTLVSIAHALVRRPKLLVVDDPTANLDMIECEQIMGLLRSAAEDGGLGVLVTVPEMSNMLHAHRIASLSNGRLLVPSTPAGDGDRGEVIDFPDRRSA
jgi:ABC-type lipoprotein export system ATPase subunit